MPELIATHQSAEPAQKERNRLYEQTNLTKLQMLYWVGQKLKPDVSLFTGTLAFTLLGPLDVARFCAAVTAVVNHSDALRTIIEEVGGIPQAHVLPQWFDEVIVVDVSAQPEPEQAAKAWITDRITRPFDLGKRLFETALLRLSPEKHIWLLHQHHLVTDAGSVFLVYKRVIALYDKVDTAQNITCEPLSYPQFADYAAQERRFWQSSAVEKALRHWEAKLSQPVKPLRFFGETAVKHSSRVTRQTHPLTLALSQKIHDLAQQKGIFALTKDLSIYNVLGAAFFALLYRLTGENRLTFLSPVHNRPTQAFKETVGLLMELCPFVVDIEEGETFLSLVGKMRRETRSTMRYYQVGSGLNVKNRVHDVMFNYHQRPFLTFNDQPVAQELLHTGAGSDSFALHVHEFTPSGELVLFFDFHEDLFTPEQQQQVIEAFETLLNAFVANPETAVADVPLAFSCQNAQPETAGNHRAIVGPRDMLELQLKRIWEELLQADEISIYDNFFDLGGSSFQAMTLFAEIEKLTGHYLSLATLLQTGTIASLAETIRTQTGKTSWETLVEVQKGAPGKRPFYCVHGGGGHVLVFARLADRLGADQPLYAFQARGLDGTQKPLHRIEEMAAHYVAELRKHQPEGPYQLGGYSMGGAVAFEMARLLHQQGQQVDLLAIIDTPAQPRHFQKVQYAVARLTEWLNLTDAQQLKLFLFLRHRLWLSPWQNLRVLLRLLRRKMRAQNAPPQASDGQPQASYVQPGVQEDKRIQLISAVNVTAFYLYVPGYYPGKVTLFRSTEGYDDPYRDTAVPHMGWHKVATEVETLSIPGRHYDIMMEDPGLETLAKLLRQRLA
jgi:thioesterase domain-containing protein/acyl carrier protein